METKTIPGGIGGLSGIPKVVGVVENYPGVIAMTGDIPKMIDIGEDRPALNEETNSMLMWFAERGLLEKAVGVRSPLI